jgi:thiamine biosynthesis lipoprotein
MTKLTDNLFNPFILPALQRAGYRHSWIPAHAADPVTDVSHRTLVPGDQLEIGDDWAIIPYGTAIDLGGCGKGYIGDRLARRIEAWPEVEGYWLSIGGDVITGGVDANGRPVTVAIESATEAGQTVGTLVSLSARRLAVATSSVMKRRGNHDGRAWHHIIDPRTGLPSRTGVVSSSVWGASLLRADVHASNLIIVGESEASAYLRRQRTSGIVQSSSGVHLVGQYGHAVTVDLLSAARLASDKQVSFNQ